MALDTSIYQNIKPVEIPDYGDMAKNAMTMSQLAMQQQQMQRQMAMQQATRQAYARNMGPDGSLNRQGLLSDLGKFDPQAMMQQQEHFNKTDKDQAEAQTAKMQALHQQATATVPVYGYLLNKSDEQASAEYPYLVKHLADQGVDTSNLPPQFDRSTIARGYQIASQYKEHLDNQKTQADTGKSLAETDKLRAETPKPFLGKIDPTMDPAAIVSRAVPKDQQPKVFEEIKNAQDIKALAPKIREAFVMGSSRNPVIAAQGQRMFEGLINTTVKDAEGTTRQAAFDSIHNTMTPSGITASPGENDNRWKTVEAYLSSKASAPMAKGHGIDLSKFDSTASYQAPRNAAPAQGGVKSAYAADMPKPGAEDGGFVFMGGDPANPKSWKKAR